MKEKLNKLRRKVEIILCQTLVYFLNNNKNCARSIKFSRFSIFYGILLFVMVILSWLTFIFKFINRLLLYYIFFHLNSIDMRRLVPFIINFFKRWRLVYCYFVIENICSQTYPCYFCNYASKTSIKQVLLK